MAGAVLEQLEHRRRGADRDAALAAGSDDAAPERPRRGGDRDDHLVRLDLVEDPSQIVGAGGAQHLQPVLVLHALLARVVVDEPDRAQAQLRIADQLTDHEASAVAAPDDQHIARALGGPDTPYAPLHHQVDEEARADQEGQSEQEEHRDHARGQRDRRGLLAGRRGDRVQEGDGAHHDERGNDDGLDDRLVVALADERPQPLVLAEHRQRHQRDRHDPVDRRGEQVPVLVVGPAETVGEPQPEGKVVSERDQHPVHEQLGHRVAMNGKGRGSDPPAHAAGF